MFSIARKPSPSPRPQSFFVTDWEPFRLMENLLRSDPFGDAYVKSTPDSTFVPRFDVKESKAGFLFKADLPGVKEENVDISLTGNRLTISGYREAEEKQEGENYYMVERTSGSFSRAFTLPETADVEKIKAEVKDGVLTLTLPKRTESQPRRIPLTK
jgi:HSP20 family protein